MKKEIPGGKFHPVIAQNPASVCCEAALLASALLSVGVPEHEKLRFSITSEDGITQWRWLFADASACGTYKTADLIKWWNSPEWLAANPGHEWAILRRTLINHAEVARRIRDTVPRLIFRRGNSMLAIPANASADYRDFLIAQLEGRIPAGEEFTGRKTRNGQALPQGGAKKDNDNE